MSGVSYNERILYVPHEVEKFRLLTEVRHLQHHMDGAGNVPPEVTEGVLQNLETAVCELGIPSAVTETIHRFEAVPTSDGRRERAAVWLGKNVAQTYIDGIAFYQHEPGKKRALVEVAEAKYGNAHTRHGVARVFISPKMSAKDGTEEEAKADHVYEDDSVRVSFPILNQNKEVTGRLLSSLLVRDIPLDAWVSMLKDEHSIFGQSFTIGDEKSALSIMEIFPLLELSVEKLPEGAVTLVAAVIPYISNEVARQQAKRQLKEFREQQEVYKKIAKQCAVEWFEFELELARSFEHPDKRATYAIRQMIVSSQHGWSAYEQAVIDAHAQGNTQYEMSDDLAAVLENAKRYLLGARAAAEAGNLRAMRDVAPAHQEAIRTKIRQINAVEATGAQAEQIMEFRRQLNHLLVRANIQVGGGCIGNVRLGAVDEQGNPVLPLDSVEAAELNGAIQIADKKDWKWKKGVCQVKACPSPKPTDVGPCSVCRRCQHEFDVGRDPTKVVSLVWLEKKPAPKAEGNVIYAIFGVKQNRALTKQRRRLASLATAA